MWCSCDASSDVPCGAHVVPQVMPYVVPHVMPHVMSHVMPHAMPYVMSHGVPHVVQVVSKESMEEDACVREFFNQLVCHHLDERCSSRRLDLLACGNVAQGTSGTAIVQQLEALLAVSPLDTDLVTELYTVLLSYLSRHLYIGLETCYLAM